MKIIRFFISRSFLIQLAIAGILLFGVIWLTLNYIESYTMHGSFVTVPDMRGLKAIELNDFIADKKVQFIVNDSIYSLKHPKGTVVDQHPIAGSQVKEGRKIYLTVNASLPQMIPLPNLKDVTLRQAVALLESFGMNVGEKKYIPDPCVNCVLYMEMEEKKLIENDRVAKGSVIDLVLGAGTSSEMIAVPFVLGLVEEEVKEMLSQKALNYLVVNYSDCENKTDSSFAKVYKQDPEFSEFNQINLGNTIRIWLTGEDSKVPYHIIDSLETKDSISSHE